MNLNKLTIRSRPLPADDTIGSGLVKLALTTEQLYLITALVCNCRLGQPSVYSRAAYELIDAIEEEFGSDFAQEASDDVDLQATIEDSQGNVVLKTDSTCFLTLEV